MTAWIGIIGTIVTILNLCLFVYSQTPSTSQVPRTDTAPRLVVQLGNIGGVGLVALSRDGKLALTAENNPVATMDFSICLWEVETGREIRRMSSHTGGLRGIAFSPDSRFAASASNDKTARVWNVETGDEVHRFEHSYAVLTVTFSPDGKSLLTTTDSDFLYKGGQGHVWELSTGSRIRTLDGHGRGIPSAAYSDDGKLIATGSWDKTVRLWNAGDGQLLRELKEPKAAVIALAFSADSKQLAVGTAENKALIFDAATGSELHKIETKSSTRSVSFSPEGRFLLTGSKYPDKKVHLWEIKSGIEAHTFAGSNQAVLSADGKYALVSGVNELGAPATLWSTNTGELVRRFQGYATVALAANVSADGNHLVTLGAGGSCRLWNLQSGTVQSIKETFEDNAGQSFIINSSVFTPDSKSLVTAESDDFISNSGGGIQFWDVETGNKTRRINTGGVGPVAISSDGKFVASGRGMILGSENTDRDAHWFRIEDGKQERKFGPHTSTVDDVAISHDMRFVLTKPSATSSDLTDAVRLWDAKSGRALHRLASPVSDARADAIAIAPDGSLSATAYHSSSNEAVISLWENTSGNLKLTLKPNSVHTGFAGQFNALSFSSDGKLLASASNDQTVRLWDVATGKEVRRFDGHADGVNSVGFSHGDRLLISASSDATIRFWSVETGREICRLLTFTEEDDSERWVVVSPDGRFDTNNLNKIQGLHWVLPDAGLHPFPLEIFLRDYYEPQLLPRLLRCVVQKNCDAQFKPVRELTKLNRVLPAIRITKVASASEPRSLEVTVEVGKSEASGESAGADSKRTTGAYDLRLFRDNQLVGYSAKNSAGASSKNAAMAFEEELQEWRAATKIELGAGGKRSFTFIVPLPNFQNPTHDIELSAYVYNEDRIKTETVRWAKAQKEAKPLKEAARQRRAYIISIGVNASQQPQWQLKYAANDAREFQRVIGARLQQTSQADVDESLYTDETLRRYARQSFYYDIVPVSLIADDELRDGKNIEIRDATKAKIHSVFDLLSGKPVSAALRRSVPNGELLQKATPDDLVLISFSCHGYADRSGNFYLLPYDIQAGENGLPDWQTAISSDELSLWLRDVDAGDMALIIDACHAAAFTGAGFKPGPMGSRGLGQLSFDKGMLVLAATQASEAAIETGGSIKQGLLSYALVHDGLENVLADYKPKNNQLTLKEWMRYAVGRVPQLNREAQSGKLKAVNAFAIRQNQNYQQPSLFDFTPKRLDVFLSKQLSK